MLLSSLFTHSIIYSTISTIYSTFNLIQLFIQLFCALTTSGQWHRSLLVKNMAAMAAAAQSGSQNAGYGNRSLWRWHKAPLRCGVWLSKVSWLGSSKNWPDFPAAYCRCRSNGAVCLLRIPRCTPRQQFEYQRPGGALPFMGYIGMCRCEGYGLQAVYSGIGYINQSVWV